MCFGLGWARFFSMAWAFFSAALFVDWKESNTHTLNSRLSVKAEASSCSIECSKIIGTLKRTRCCIFFCSESTSRLVHMQWCFHVIFTCIDIGERMSSCRMLFRLRAWRAFWGLDVSDFRDALKTPCHLRHRSLPPLSFGLPTCTSHPHPHNDLANLRAY